MGKNFLSKKSWHTSTIPNIEKVWLAENKKKDEEAKTAQWKREKDEEKRREEMQVCVRYFFFFFCEIVSCLFEK
jgi:hypothetical protein